MPQSRLLPRVLVLSALCAWLGSASTSQAAVIVNQGFNVQAQTLPQFANGFDSAATPVGFYNGGPVLPTGTFLKPATFLSAANPSYTFTFNAAAVFGPGANPGLGVESAVLFVDLALPFPAGSDITIDINGTGMGTFDLQTSGTNQIPLIGGGTTTALFEDDNLFLTLPSSLFDDLEGDTTFSITLTRASGSFLVDGINLQAVLTPEPTSMLVFGLATVGAMGCGWYRRRRTANAA